KKTTQIIRMTVVALAFLMSSCGDNQNSTNMKNVMKLDECKLELNIPSGWKLDSQSMCSKGDATGIFDFESLNGRTFDGAVEQISTEFGSKIISKDKMQVAEKKAVKVYIDAENDVKLLRVYVDCGDKIAYISYAVPKNLFASYEPDLLKSIDSIKQK
ncbi:MAG TPA: hypothetical protein P5105_02700, partial [Victivallales bacterium]|nr:hypothetical protein [Victivallales bacterium]